VHTPDVLASGYFLKVFVLDYGLTGDKELLDAARYWAWTVAPFLFLAGRQS
jgi:hypothetical protein